MTGINSLPSVSNFRADIRISEAIEAFQTDIHRTEMNFWMPLIFRIRRVSKKWRY